MRRRTGSRPARNLATCHGPADTPREIQPRTRPRPTPTPSPPQPNQTGTPRRDGPRRPSAGASGAAPPKAAGSADAASASDVRAPPYPASSATAIVPALPPDAGDRNASAPAGVATASDEGARPLSTTRRQPSATGRRPHLLPLQPRPPPQPVPQIRPDRREAHCRRWSATGPTAEQAGATRQAPTGPRRRVWEAARTARRARRPPRAL